MEEKKEIIFYGIPASPGIAIGKTLIIGFHSTEIFAEKKTINKSDIEPETKKLENAFSKTNDQLKFLQKRLQKKIKPEDAGIFDAQRYIVDDKVLHSEVVYLIENKLYSADYAFSRVANKYISAISVVPDSYIRERASDVQDVADRVLGNLHGRSGPVLDNLTGERIIIAKDLTPSNTAMMDREKVQAFALETGSRTSHTAILARSLKIPAVVGMQNIFTKADNGQIAIIDGFLGTVILNPCEETQEHYAQKEQDTKRRYAELMKENKLRPDTLDGYRIQLAANVKTVDQLSDVKDFAAAGIGLFRTEYIYTDENEIPTEEKQFQIYKKLAEAMENYPVVIRTIDICGDKFSDIISEGFEENPFLGLRGIRLCLSKKDLLITQLRALIRASAFGAVKILIPMVSTLQEVESVIQMIEEIKSDFKSKNIDFNPDIELGIMIETPASALTAETLGEKVDFFSIGTNDLVQYTMAADRTNSKVAYLNRPANPAVLKLIKMVVKAAEKNNIWVSVCGEVAGDVTFTPILLGLGINELSMNPIFLGSVRRLIRRIRMYQAEDVALKALTSSNAEEAIQHSVDLIEEIAPDVYKLSKKGI